MTRIFLKGFIALGGIAGAWFLYAGIPQAAPVGKVETPAARDFKAVAAIIDKEIDAELKESMIPASPLADDAEFLRRASLDITGKIPGYEKAAAFINSTDPDKRAKLVDELLASADYGKHFATIWQNRIMPPTTDVRRVNGEPFHTWLAESFNKNRGWDKIVYDMIAAEGDGDKNPQVTFWIAQVDGNRIAPNKATASCAQLFLGVQLQCAECHNHPFTGWKQTDFWSVAAFFGRVQMDRDSKAQVKAGGLPGVSELIKGGGDRKAGKGKDRTPVSAGATIVIPETKGKVVSAKFLEGAAPTLDPKQPFRPSFAEWATSGQNKFFANAAVNRTWNHFFGRGFVMPVDDFHAGNPPSHPTLLKNLAGELVASGFDLKHLIRGICASKTYQRTSRPLPGNDVDTTLFSHMNVKVMSPEMLFDCLTSAMGTELARDTTAPRKAAGNKGGGGTRAQFVAFFNTGDENTESTEFTHGIPQALRLMNSPQFNRGGPVVAEVMKKFAGDKAKIIEALYLSALTRKPTAAESKRMLEYVAKQSDAKTANASVLWVLLNSSEFILNH